MQRDHGDMSNDNKLITTKECLLLTLSVKLVIIYVQANSIFSFAPAAATRTTKLGLCSSKITNHLNTLSNQTDALESKKLWSVQSSFIVIMYRIFNN